MTCLRRPPQAVRRPERDRDQPSFGGAMCGSSLVHNQRRCQKRSPSRRLWRAAGHAGLSPAGIEPDGQLGSRTIQRRPRFDLRASAQAGPYVDRFLGTVTSAPMATVASAGERLRARRIRAHRRLAVAHGILDPLTSSRCTIEVELAPGRAVVAGPTSRPRGPPTWRARLPLLRLLALALSVNFSPPSAPHLPLPE